jgi:hypothetical protein
MYQHSLPEKICTTALALLTFMPIGDGFRAPMRKF